MDSISGAEVDKSYIPDEGMNVEEVMRKIKEKIKMRRAVDISSKSEDMTENGTEEKQEYSLHQIKNRRELEYINTNWDIQNNNYFISSHRPILGKALVSGRELIHGEVRRYVDPVIWKQKEFNSCIVRIINEITERIGTITLHIEDKITKFQADLSDQIEDKIAKSQADLSYQVEDKIAKSQAKTSSEISEQVKSVIAAMNEDIENRAWLAEILDNRIAKGNICTSNVISDSHADCIDYFVFEERFRGSRADIKGRQTAFIKHFKGCKNVLDIGCGRGEFQELLREHGIGGHGIDINEDMVNFCKSKGLNVERIDAVSYLHKLEDKSLDGIFIDQVVEHLEQEYLIMMLNLSYRKLMYGGTIIVETVNPLSFFSFANFYIDISHKRPVHPETLRFLLNAAGFREIQIELIAPVRDDARLKKIKKGERNDEYNEEIEIYNHNIDMLNATIYGPQDYALIGIK